jgi:hypothetical protein
MNNITYNITRKRSNSISTNFNKSKPNDDFKIYDKNYVTRMKLFSFTKKTIIFIILLILAFKNF